MMFYVELLLSLFVMLAIVLVLAYILIGWCFAMAGSFSSTAKEDLNTLLFWPYIIRDWWRKRND